MAKFNLAVCQMDSQDDKQANLQTAAEMIKENAARGAALIAFPENVNFMGRGYRRQAEEIPGETSEFFCAQAKEHGVWLVTGSFPEREAYGDIRTPEKGGKPKNTLLVINPKGEIVCKYSKIHLFDVDLSDGSSWKESDSATPGDEIVLVDTDFGRIGLAICYDLRFPEMFRLMAMHGADVIVLPASFTMQTGKDHWEIMLRARAMENGVYIAAPNQIGNKSNMIALGKSMIVDPWGHVIAGAGNRACSFMAEIDTDYAKSIRAQLPLLQNRRADLYDVTSAKVRIY